MNGSGIFFKIIYSIFSIAFVMGLFLIFLYSLGKPVIEHEAQLIILDRDGQLLTDSSEGFQEIEDAPPYLIDALLLTEDRHFYEHFGIDFRGILRALLRNIQAGQLKEGASTLTQQLARNLYLSHEKTWTRKAKEFLYTARIEMFYDKEEILLAYLKTIYFGHGAYGIHEASRLYFDKSVDQLSLAEAAMLIGIPKGPTYYSPYNHLDNAMKRQELILDKLLAAGKISQAQYVEAKQEELLFQENNAQAINHHDYFFDYLWQEMTETIGLSKEQLFKERLTIETTLDPSLQSYGEEIIEKADLQDRELEFGMVAIDPHTGAIRQLAGGKDYAQSPFNRVMDGKRMVGSTFKPLLYYAALEHGFTATTMLQSEPTAFILEDGEAYEPSNYNQYYAYQPISLAQALALSDNIYAVKTHLFLSAEVVVETARRFGIQADLPKVASLALGSASIPLIEMVQAYAMIANNGYPVQAYAIERVRDQEGRLIYEKKHERKERVLHEANSFLLTHLMTGMFDRRLNGYMEVTGSSIIDQLEHEYAGKSGTTNADSWMIGFSPKLVAGVWTGYDDNRPLTRLPEKALAKQAWADFMHFAHRKEAETLRFRQPQGIVSKLIDVETGLLATEDCAVTRTTYFLKGTEPTNYCQDHLPQDEEDELDEKRSLFKKVIEWLP